MKFGQSAEEAEASAQENTGRWIRYMKDGDTTFRLLQEPKDWIYFWEHYNPGGFSFPCTQDRKTCPGCTSDVEKMKKASRKVVFNVLQGDYVNVYKVPPLLADKLKMRAERIGTITDREYTITRYKTSGDKTEYDVEGQPPAEIDVSKYELIEVEPLLAESYNEAWGDPVKARETEQSAREAAASRALSERVNKATNGTPEHSTGFVPPTQTQDPPSEPAAEQNTQAAGSGERNVEVTEAFLLGLNIDQLREFAKSYGLTIPVEFTETAPAVEWMKKQD